MSIKSVVSTCAFVCLLSTYAITEELILQNTPNGYNGCQDTYVENQQTWVNFGTKDFLKLYLEGC